MIKTSPQARSDRLASPVDALECAEIVSEPPNAFSPMEIQASSALVAL
jgi:hypothetical protein